MAIPIISDIWEGILFLIGQFLDKAPKPLKFFLFMLFLVALVAIIPFFMHIIGYHCNTDLETVQTSPLKLATNIRVAFLDENDIINTSSFEPDLIGIGILTIEACKRSICFNNGEAYFSVEDECENETTLYPFALDSGAYDWVRCVECEGGIFNKTFIKGTFGASETKNLCFADAYARNESDMNWLQSAFCDPSDRCIPPEYYKYEYDTGTYDCIEPEICGLNNTKIISEVDDLLLNAGAQLVYTNSNEKSYENMVKVKCDAQLRPNITFFGIPVFDYKIWLMLGVIATLFIFLKNIKAH